MKYWIKRGGRIFGSGAFFIVLSVMMVQPEGLRVERFLYSLIYAAGIGIVCWLIGIIISDIILKGIITDVECDEDETVFEGGILQRLVSMKEQLTPGSEEIPFVDIKQDSTGSVKKKDA